MGERYKYFVKYYVELQKNNPINVFYGLFILEMELKIPSFPQIIIRAASNYELQHPPQYPASLLPHAFEKRRWMMGFQRNFSWKLEPAFTLPILTKLIRLWAVKN